MPQRAGRCLPESIPLATLGGFLFPFLLFSSSVLLTNRAMDQGSSSLVPTAHSSKRVRKNTPKVQELEDVAVEKEVVKRKNVSSSEENEAHSSHDTLLSEVRGTCAARSLNCLVHGRVRTGILCDTRVLSK